MAGMNLSLSFAGDVQLNRTLMGISDRAMDFRPAFHEIADKVLELERRQFQTEGGFGSGGWPALAESTKAARVAQGYGPGPILDKTGALKRSLTIKGDAAQSIVISAHQFAFASLDPKLPFHQKGTANMPARKQEFPESARRDLVKIAQRHWIEGTRR